MSSRLVSKNQNGGAPNGKKNFEDMCVTVQAQYRRVTDRRTDGRTDILPRHSPRYAYASRGKIGRHFIKVMNEYRVARCSMAHSVYFSHTWCLRLCSSLTQFDDSISSRVNTFFVEVFSEVVEQTTISTELVVFSVFRPAALPSQIALLSVQFNSKCNASPGIFSAYVRPTYRRVHKKNLKHYTSYGIIARS